MANLQTLKTEIIEAQTAKKLIDVLNSYEFRELSTIKGEPIESIDFHIKSHSYLDEIENSFINQTDEFNHLGSLIKNDHMNVWNGMKEIVNRYIVVFNKIVNSNTGSRLNNQLLCDLVQLKKYAIKLLDMVDKINTLYTARFEMGDWE